MNRLINRHLRAAENYASRKNFQYEYSLSEGSRLTWNDAYVWCCESFGEPGERWDFYYQTTKFDYTRFKTSDSWTEWFGFSDSADATLFVLRWT